MEIKKNFTIISNKLIYDPDITCQEFRVLVTLMSFGYGDNPSFPSQELVSKKIGISDRAIRNHISSLKSKGYITYKRRGFNKSNQYTFLSVRKGPSCIRGSNLPPNNTSNKTINNPLDDKETREGMELIRDILRRKGVTK